MNKTNPLEAMVGQRYGQVTILGLGGKNSQGKTTLIGLCGCGVEKPYAPRTVRRPTFASCGCVRDKATSVRHKKHGLTHTPEYQAWVSMRSRCNNPNSQSYYQYGARGIMVCPTWNSSFEQFLADMGPKPDSAHSLDRTDNDGHYEPDNCRWATMKTQSNNRRAMKLSKRVQSTNKSGCIGVYYRPTRTGRWVARIRAGEKEEYLGTFTTLLDAACARKSAELHYDKLRGRLD